MKEASTTQPGICSSIHPGQAGLPTPALEALEPRLAPAGTLLLTTAGGVLTITGDGAANGIKISDVPGSGEWKIEDTGGLSTTFILNGAVIASGTNISSLGLTTIKATLGDGDDIIEIQPSATPSSMLVPGGITINAGKGDDDVRLLSVSSNHLMVGALTVDLGEGNDLFQSILTATFSGAVKILGGLGNDDVFLQGAGADLTFLKGLSVDMGAGQDDFLATTLRIGVAGALSVTGAGLVAQTSTINFTSSIVTVDGAVNLAIGAGTSQINLGDSSTDVYQFGAGVKITGSKLGDDSVTFEGVHTYVGGVVVDLKDGMNSTTLAANSTLGAASLAVTGGIGADSFLQDDNSRLLLNTTLGINFGNGTNDWKADPGAELTANTVSFTGGVNGDTVNYAGSNLRVLGNLTLNTGAGGTGSINLAPTVAAYVGGNLTLTGGLGNDDVDLTSPEFRIGAALKIGLGKGTNLVETFGDALHVAGGVSYMGGSDADRLDFQNTNLVVARALQFVGGGVGTGFSDILYVRPLNASLGSVTQTGTAGNDILALGEITGASTRITVYGAVNASLGTGFSQAIYLTDTAVQGAVNLTTASGVGEFDTVLVTGSSFNSVFNGNFGNGTTSININQLTMRGAFNLNTGGGSDTVNLDTQGGSTDLSYWFGLVKINLGAGADTIAIGTNPVVANAGNNFYRNVFVDGGADADTFTVAQPGSNNYVAGSVLTQVNFP